MVSVKKSSGGLWYAEYPPAVVDPFWNRVLVACIGGSAEFGSYTAPDMTAEVLRVVEKNGFPQDHAKDKLPFWVIAPLATKGPSIADHSLIAKEIGNVVKGYDVDVRFQFGLSWGGATVTGTLLQVKNSTEITKGIASQYRNPEVWDGHGILCGNIPGIVDNKCAAGEKYVFIVGSTGDKSVPVSNQYGIMNNINGCASRVGKVVANEILTYKGSEKVYTNAGFPEGAMNMLYVIISPNDTYNHHADSWTTTYTWNATSGPGYECRKWMERVAKTKIRVDGPIEVTALLDEANMTATFYKKDGNVTYGLWNLPGS